MITMIKIPVYNLKGEKVEEVNLNPKIFEVKFKPDLINRVILATMARRRIPAAHTKTRSEARGGGRKPWRQKGTGRARHGSIRSPLWVGGGVTFGPRREKKYSKKINKKEKRLALFSALSKKLDDKEIKVIDEIETKEGKTKEFLEIFSNLYDKDKKKTKKLDLLIVLPKSKEQLIWAIKNLQKTKVILADSLNVEDLMLYKNVLIEKPSLKVMEETYLKQ